MECQQGQNTTATKQKKLAKSLEIEWNKNISFLFHCQITRNWVNKNILFLFHCTFFGPVGIPYKTSITGTETYVKYRPILSDTDTKN